MNILVIDGQGGGLGKALIEKLCAAKIAGAEITAVGTNSTATMAMLRAGAPQGATGENAVCYNAKHANIIVGGGGILCANAMLGEISPRMAAAVSESEAVKLIIPLDRCQLRVCGTADVPLPQKLDMAVEEIRRLCAGE